MCSRAPLPIIYYYLYYLFTFIYLFIFLFHLVFNFHIMFGVCMMFFLPSCTVYHLHDDIEV